MPDFENLTPAIPHIVLVVDESGSMQVSRDTTVSAINDYLQGLKTSLPHSSRVTVVKFDSSYATVGEARSPLQMAPPLGMGMVSRSQTVRIEKLLDRVPLGEVLPVKAEDYRPNGGTPLYDAVGRTMVELDAALSVEPGPVYFAILTDGEENSSREFKLETIRAMITDRTAQGWTIAFLGVDIDAYATGHSFGVSTSSTVSLSRGTIGATMSAVAGSVARKYKVFEDLGGDAQAYASFNAGDETFTDEEKKDLESR